MDDLLKDAIADAKAVRETALANAKIALEEAFTPRIQSMLSDKIQSEMEGEEEEAPEEAPVEGEEPEAEEEPEIAAEPEVGEEPAGEEDVLSAQDEVPGEEEPAAEPEDVLAAQDEIPGDEFSEPEAEVPGEEEELEAIEGVIEINGVKYAPVVSEEEGEEEGENPFAAEPEESVDELDLEAILRELEDEVNEEDEIEEDYDESGTGDGLSSDEAETADEADLAEDLADSSEIGAGDNKVDADSADSSDVGQGSEEPASADAPAAGHENPEEEEVDDLVEVNGVKYAPVVDEQDEWEARNGDLEKNESTEEDIDLEEILRALSEQDEEEGEAAEEQVSKLTSELGEHRKVVKYLRSKLNEVNLLNAKLLFTNKLFRAYGLTNEQKLKVVENFDRATNLREVKLVFATLAESFGHGPASTVKQQIKEKKGSASKAVASTKPKSPKVIGEGFDMKQRFQKLANIL